MLILTCKGCGSTLTKTGRWGSKTDFDPDFSLEGGVEARRPSVPPGVFVKLAWQVLAGRAPEGETIYPSGMTGETVIVVGLCDVADDVLHSAGKDSGCCGSDGCDGPNRACQCGVLVATESSDCWTPAHMAFVSDNVSAVLDSRC